MGMYSSSGRPEMPSFAKRTMGHPIWGALGIMLAVLLPILAYAAARLTLAYPKAVEWLGLSASAYRPLPKIGIPQGVLWLTIGYAALFYALYALVYALLYAALRVTPYTPLDVKRPLRRKRRLSPDTGVRVLGALGVLIALVGSVWLVRLDLSHGWVAIPPGWLVPGPVPLAGVYFLLFLVLLAILWTLAAVIAWLFNAARPPREDTEY